MKKWLLLALLSLPCALKAQVVGPGTVDYVTSAPSGTCSQGAHQQNVLGSGLIYTCQSGTWAQVGAGAGSVTSGTAGQIAVYAANGTTVSGSNTIIGGINAAAYGVQANGHIVSGPTFTNASSTVTCTLCNFTGTDAQGRANAIVGQIVFGTNASSDVGALTSVLVTPECLIQSIDSATQIHMGTVGSIGTACNATASTSAAGFIVWGNLDSATSSQSPSTANDPLLNAWTAAADNCQALILPSGVMLVERGEFNTNSTGTCSTASSTTFLRSGFGIQGQGAANTILVPTPNFVTADCASVCFFGAKANAQIQDLQLTGVGNSACGSGFNGKILTQITGDATNNGTNFSLRHVIFQGWCANQAGTIGFQIGSATNSVSGGFISDSIIEALGMTGTNVVSGAGNGLMVQVSNSQFTACGTGGSCLVMAAGIWSSSHTFYGYTASTTNNAILCNTNSVCIFDGDNMPYVTGTGVSQIGCITCTLKISNSFISGGYQAIGTGGTTRITINSSTLSGSNASIGCGGASVICNIFDTGGNTLTGAISAVSGGVANMWQSASITGTACATGNWALTSGWGSSAVATAAGNSHQCHMTITGASGSAAPVLTWTFPTAYLVAPLSCLLSGGAATADLTDGRQTSLSKTAVAFTFTGTPSAQTYTFDVSCGP